jgi:hypothetical protein
MKNEEIAKINEVSHPDAGTNVQSHKLNPAGEGQAEAYRFSVNNTVTDTKESDSQSAKECLDTQLGRGEHSASRTGGRLGDSTPQPECGCGE